MQIGGSVSPVPAEVTEIILEGEALRIRLAVESDTLQGGEYAAVKFEKQSEHYGALVPGAAVFGDGLGYYVWVVRNRRGAFGAEYYAAKVKIIIADRDDNYAAVSRGLEYPEPVVTSYSKDLTVNGTIMPHE
jgi:hypothetical protein